ncbi:MAG: ATP-binding protein, partial [Myxococcales bacterium]
VGIAVAMPAGELVYVNAAFERMWHRPFLAESAAGEPLLLPQSRRIVDDAWPLARALAGQQVANQEIRIERGDGSPATTLQSAAPVFDAEGRPLAAVVTAMDITELKHAMQDLERAAQFRESFLGIVSHDLRNPLNAITIASRYLLTGGQLTEKDARLVARIARSSERMARMIRDLLDFTRGRLGGGIPLERTSVNLRHLCRHLCEELEISRPGRVVRLLADGDFVGRWDEDRLTQAISNLGTNALDYSPEDTEVTLRLVDDGPRVRIEVHNRGEPIPPERLGALFEPFRRAGEAPPNAGGLGLGLYIVRLIAEAHGGSVSVRSKREEGTLFTVTLPRG